MGPLEAVKITIGTTKQVHELLEKIHETGLYGLTLAETAERILIRGVQGVMLDAVQTQGK